MQTITTDGGSIILTGASREGMCDLRLWIQQAYGTSPRKVRVCVQRLKTTLSYAVILCILLSYVSLFCDYNMWYYVRSRCQDDCIMVGGCIFIHWNCF